MILFDVRVRFAADISVPPPQSMLFYPVMGYVVECLFHAVPLAVLVAAGLPRFTSPGPIIVFVALIEPVFQALAAPPEGFPSWARVYVTLQIFAINLIQLVLFRRSGFLTMYGFRLVYYLCWHIVWGYARLALLF